MMPMRCFAFTLLIALMLPPFFFYAPDALRAMFSPHSCLATFSPPLYFFAFSRYAAPPPLRRHAARDALMLTL